MSHTRRNFSAKFKSDLVLEVLKGEKELNVIATENGIQPNLLRKYIHTYNFECCHSQSGMYRLLLCITRQGLVLK